MEILGKILSCVQFVPSAVHAVEVLFGHRSSAEKKDAALTLVSEAAGVGEIVGNSPIGDQELFKQGLSEIIDGVVRCLNASVWSKKQ